MAELALFGVREWFGGLHPGFGTGRYQNNDFMRPLECLKIRKKSASNLSFIGPLSVLLDPA